MAEESGISWTDATFNPVEHGRIIPGYECYCVTPDGKVWSRFGRNGKPDYFDENTPPPRTRPQGQPIPAYVSLPPGESVAAVFREWDRAGRIPEGCVLCRLVGRSPDMATDQKKSDPYTPSGYRVECYPDTPKLQPVLGKPGHGITDEQLEEYRVRVAIRQMGSTFAVFAPEE